jgi:RNA-directed DNA polymerase
MTTGIARIAELVSQKPEYKLQTLIHLVNEETLRESHRQMAGNKATGIDGVTKARYAEELERNLSGLVERMKRQQYKPQPVKRVYIEKPGSKGQERPLGIPAYEDRLVQRVMSEVLGTIYEPIFLDFSYGFRPGRSCHEALKQLNYNIVSRKTRYVVEADIKGFFANLDHEWMMRILQERIADQNFLRVIKRFLTAEVIEEAKRYETDKGTPQGGLISPILANVYLHYALDLWFEKVIKVRSRGDASIVRYADDFVCCFQNKDDAEAFLRELRIRLQKFGLELAESKTRIIEFGRFAEEDRERRGEGKPKQFDFLGFTHICSKTQNGSFMVKRITSKKKLKVKKQVAKQWLRENRHLNLRELIMRLNRKLTGHYRYYGITGNYKSLNKFRHYVLIQLYKTLNKRGQSRKMKWEKFNQLINQTLLVKLPKIYVSMYAH